MKNKKRKYVLKKWFEKLNCWNLGLWFMFVATTIDNVLENSLYDTVLIVWSLFAIGSFILLSKFTNVFDN